MSRSALFSAGVLGFLGVAAGAFGAHGLASRVSPADLAIWKTGALYQLLHAVVLGVVALLPASRTRAIAEHCFRGGIVVFSGTLYAITLGAPRWLGAITPLGGLLLLAGWLLVAACGLRMQSPRT